VIIEKLPFAAPNDPVLQARLELLRKQGLNPFMSYQVPQAAIALKQGVGRLLRDPSDRGVVVIADVRLKTKPYGIVFLESLPPMPVTRDIADVEEFFNT
jgi:ATP-dependent DNA helicase DinG